MIHPLAVWDRIRCGGESQSQLLKSLPNHMVSEMRLMCAALEENFFEVLAQLIVMVKCPAHCSLHTAIEKTQELLESIAALPRPRARLSCSLQQNLHLRSEGPPGTFLLGEVTPDTHDLAKLKRVEQSTEQARVEVERLATESVNDEMNNRRQHSYSSLSKGGRKRAPKEMLAEKEGKIHRDLLTGMAETARLAAAKKNEASRLALDRCVELAICDMSAANKGETPVRSRTEDLEDKRPPHTRLVSSEPFLRALRYVVEDGKSGFEFLSIEESKSMHYLPALPTSRGMFTRTSWALRGLVLDCMRPSSDGTMFRYTPSAFMLQTFAKGWKHGPRAGVFAAQPSPLLKLEPCLLDFILDNPHNTAFARMAVLVCKYLQTLARTGPNFQTKMALGKSSFRKSSSDDDCSSRGSSSDDFQGQSNDFQRRHWQRFDDTGRWKIYDDMGDDAGYGSI